MIYDPYLLVISWGAALIFGSLFSYGVMYYIIKNKYNVDIWGLIGCKVWTLVLDGCMIIVTNGHETQLQAAIGKITADAIIILFAVWLSKVVHGARYPARIGEQPRRVSDAV